VAELTQPPSKPRQSQVKPIGQYNVVSVAEESLNVLTLAAGAKTAVNEYFMERGDWPENNDEAGLADKHDIIRKYTAYISVKDNVIEIQFGYDAHTDILNEKIGLTAVDNDGSISWTCASTGIIQANHLPAACRTEKEKKKK